MAFTQPSVQDFKDYFTRSFVYGVTPDTVTDTDILNAQNRASYQIAADGCFSDQGEYDIAHNLLSAHFLVTNLNAATQGASGKASWHRNSHSVGSVSESFAIPQEILNSAYFSQMTKTSYGQEYAMMIWPKIRGQVFIVEGCTTP